MELRNQEPHDSVVSKSTFSTLVKDVRRRTEAVSAAVEKDQRLRLPIDVLADKENSPCQASKRTAKPNRSPYRATVLAEAPRTEISRSAANTVLDSPVLPLDKPENPRAFSATAGNNLKDGLQKDYKLLFSGMKISSFNGYKGASRLSNILGARRHSCGGDALRHRPTFASLSSTRHLLQQSLSQSTCDGRVSFDTINENSDDKRFSLEPEDANLYSRSIPNTHNCGDPNTTPIFRRLQSRVCGLLPQRSDLDALVEPPLSPGRSPRNIVHPEFKEPCRSPRPQSSPISSPSRPLTKMRSEAENRKPSWSPLGMRAREAEQRCNMRTNMTDTARGMVSESMSSDTNKRYAGCPSPVHSPRVSTAQAMKPTPKARPTERVLSPRSSTPSAPLSELSVNQTAYSPRQKSQDAGSQSLNSTEFNNCRCHDTALLYGSRSGTPRGRSLDDSVVRGRYVSGVVSEGTSSLNISCPELPVKDEEIEQLSQKTKHRVDVEEPCRPARAVAAEVADCKKHICEHAVDSVEAPLVIPTPVSTKNEGTEFPVPSVTPSLTESEWMAIREHEQWLNEQLSILSAQVPESKKAALKDDQSAINIPEDKFVDTVTPTAGSLEDKENGDGSPKSPSSASSSVQVNAKFMKEVHRRFWECRQLGHLPTLNLCFTLLETVLLIGNKRSMNALLSRANIRMLITVMQFNPKLNALAATRRPHMESFSKRIQTLPLSGGVAELAETVYALQYLKDVVVPVVCDDSRFQQLNVHLTKMKSKLAEAVFNDERLLLRLFTDLREGHLPESKKLDYLRFLKELLELATANYPGDASVFWKRLLCDFKLISHMTALLAHSCPLLRRACVDLAHLLCDEDCRKVMFTTLSQHGDFFRRLFDIFCDYSGEEGTILQLQHALPMLVVSPHRDVLVLFYDAAEAVLKHWLEAFEKGGLLPPRLFISVLMELLSLAVHHHCRMFSYHHPTCVRALIDLISVLWNRAQRPPSNVMVAVNKGILSILHLGDAELFDYMVQREVFKGVLFHFTESNNLLTSSILTLLHTILQLKIAPLMGYINWLWFEHPAGTASPRIRTPSFVQQLFYAQYTQALLDRSSAK